MANRTFLKYFPARLKPLSSPAVWAPLTVFALASIFMWEYYQNPDWFARPQADTTSSASGLTPEEQARLADVDTVDVLLNSLKGSNSPNDSNGNPTSGATGLGNENTSAAQDPASTNKLADRTNPFAAYEEQYKFPGSNSGTSTPAPALPAASPAVRPADGATGSGNFGSSNGSSNSSSLPAGGALSEALGRQQDSRTAADQARQNTAGSASQSASQSPRADTASSSGGAFRPAAQPSNSGISVPFIRTTSDMSPPPGTTGYRAPASSSLPVFNAAPQQPSRSPYSNPPASRQPSFNQPAARPVTPAASSVPSASSDGKLYTAPSFTQPEQNRRGQ